MRNLFTFLLRPFTHNRIEDLREGSLLVPKIDSELTENMRALRLVATLCDQLLSRGMAASDVVYMGMGITSTYCLRKVHIDISYTILTISQDRGIDREPLTLVRTVAPRNSDYHTVQLLEELARDVRSGGVSLKDAEQRLDEILTRKPLYKNWLVHIAGGGVSSGVVMLYSDNPVVWLIALVMGVLVSYTIHHMTKAGIPGFYAQALSGLIITLVAVATALVASSGAVPFLVDVNPTLVIIGGIVMLVAGMMIVAAFQDALDEYYVTATARLLKVMMMTGGIVLGVTVGLYVATRLGVQLAATPDRLSLAAINYQYVGAAVLAASFALGNYARPIGVVSAGLVGFLSLYVSLVMTSLGTGVIAGHGIAAVFVGLAAVFLFRLFRIPTLVTMSSGIIPLVPGLTLYGALTYIAQSTPDTADFETGIALLLRALLIAVIIAAGVTFGNLIARPTRIRRALAHNRLPQWRLGRRK